MSFDICYHELVVKEDIPRLSLEWREKIKRAIENRLTTRPEAYGKPLRQSLKGYRKLRVGDWRVIFRIDGKTIKIFIIQHRSVVYKMIQKRI
ncbi:MAG: cytotoxic translational repressor of toxin-antitoxin stability system [Parcubacteria group bacterium Gr01-1014_30]|nr:MAG: cytotoxic translational repressor of toxin-antitoxin stability system [Parcubacteria group bacterium Gr01-1014_30]